MISHSHHGRAGHLCCVLLLATAGAGLSLPAQALQSATAETVMATVTTRSLLRGETVQAADIMEAPRPAPVARGSVALAGAVGRAARRALPEGSVVRPGDLMPPMIVNRGEGVSIEVVKGAMRISTNGKALDSGAAGAAVRVVALPTNRTLDAVVAGPGLVRVRVP